MSDKTLPAINPNIFAMYLQPMREVARKLGYAIALHGSLVNDMDVISVPWVEEACDRDALIKAIAEEVQGRVEGEWTKMPHGRWSRFIVASGATVIDFGVMETRDKDGKYEK